MFLPSGVERFKTLPLKNCQNSDGVIFLFDVTNEETFKHVLDWIKGVEDNIIHVKNEKINPVIYLIGNKMELPERAVKKEDIEKYEKI